MVKDIKETPIKAVLYYVSKAEHADPDFMDSIRKEFADYKKQGYQPVVFISGDGDLKECMYYLMKHNLELMATHPERFRGRNAWVKEDNSSNINNETSGD